MYTFIAKLIEGWIIGLWLCFMAVAIWVFFLGFGVGTIVAIRWLLAGPWSSWSLWLKMPTVAAWVVIGITTTAAVMCLFVQLSLLLQKRKGN